MGEYRELTTAEGTFSVYIDWPGKVPSPAVVVLHEIFGINKDMRESCREFAEQGFIALCPDLFWRKERGLDLNHWSEDEWKKGLSLYQSYDFALGVHDVEAVLTMARSLPECNGKAGLTGYCLGGLMTFLTSARSQVTAAAAYYGGGTQNYLSDAKTLKSPFIMHLGTEDEYISSDDQAKIRDALKGHDNATIYSYPGCAHAFTRHTGTRYDEAAAKLANTRTYQFFHQFLN
ncbi:dienelactone hydrolase family protein [Dyella flava]|uniref:Dienelactone hydrolase family protein n=1 Tax=Dyella flava TaxID=1920170 RepID=A0ABS2JYF0_9GAMM|nr:dienelactone hydrolase family protein [Dyella flava]MBM7124027.1 dienelactone hydrolase family protein [Dyella flava]GLQ52348.1 carboxymethylenebutenolidase [Dyella flava]